MPAQSANAQDLVLIEDIQDNTLIMKNGGLRQIVMVGGTNFSLKSAAEQNILTQAYQNFLNSLNFQIQVLIHSRKINIERYLSVLQGRGETETAPLLKNQITEYREFIRSFVEQNAIMAKTFFVVVPFSPVSLPSKSSILGFLPFGKKKEEAQKETESKEEFRKNVEQLAQRTSQVTEGLRSIGLETVILENEALVELFYNFYNPGNSEKHETPTHV